MKIAILGYDTEGTSSFRYFAAQGHELEIRDQNSALSLPEGVSSVLGDTYLDDLDQFDLIVRTAGLPPHKILAKNPGVAGKITTQVNEFLKVSPSRNIIGVTGTKGKGTTSTLIANILEADGKDVQLGGNIGVAVLDLLPTITSESWVVLELSSFQLADMKASPHIAVCLMIADEHLDWHGDKQEYMASKANLFRQQTADDIAIYFHDNEGSQQVVAASEANKIPYYAQPGAIVQDESFIIDGQVICKTDEIQLLGAHNWQNVCAAITTAWQVTQDIPAIRAGLMNLASLPHRIELVREVDGVRYYNDSYSSVFQATQAAIEAVPGRKIVIIGGYDRMLDIDYIGAYMQAHATSISQLILIGDSSKRLESVLEHAGFDAKLRDPELTTMSAIVAKARSISRPGDAVILSPGFPSFDMFKNFTDRGEQFKEAVKAL